MQDTYELEDAPGDVVVFASSDGFPLIGALRAEGHAVRPVESGEALHDELAQAPPHVLCFATPNHAKADVSDDVVVVDVQREGWDAAGLERACAAVRDGVRIARLRRALRRLHREPRRVRGKLVGSSARMRALAEQVERVARVRVPVLLEGESGTGKELVARAIHDGGDRAEGPFVALNCAAIAESLQENELFGHERGAFTGAAHAFPGRFEQADGGTLFLDEIGDMAPSVQARLLRVLQDGKVQRLGGTKERRVDVRVVAATHKDLAGLVRTGAFREDLFFRIRVYPIALPPLRDRPEDIPLLVLHFLRLHAKEGDGSVKSVDPEALDLLCLHRWPGNVRELENAVRRAVIASDGTIGVPIVRAIVAEGPRLGVRVRQPSRAAERETIVPLAELERRAIAEALRITNGNVAEAARRLGIGRATLYRKCRSTGALHGDSAAG